MAAVAQHVSIQASSQDPSNAPAQRVQGFVEQARSASQSSLRLRVSHLPQDTSTWDIYKYFCRYGSLVRITIFETRSGERARTAEVEYQPRPAEHFWPSRLKFQLATESGPVTTIFVEEARNQKQWNQIHSPVRAGVRYDERQEIFGKCLDFGFLASPKSMTVMRSCQSIATNKPRLLLNLAREEKEIEVYFSFEQTSRTRSSVREFRFKIALDDALKLWHLEDNTLLISLPRPPWYSKQLKEEIEASHSKDARMWSIEDTWARQTDIVDFTSKIKAINTSAVSVHKTWSFINTARWTTFRFHIDDSSLNNGTASIFLDALRDWNIKIQTGSDVLVTLGTPALEQDTWALIDGISQDHSSFWQGLEMSVHLPFSVRYHLEVCLSHGYLSEYSLRREFFEQLAAWPEGKAKQALIHLATSQKRLFDPMQLFVDIQYLKPVKAKRLPENCMEIHSATVTASGILFHTPSVEITNRIIRQHRSQAHRFLRVRFEDDAYRGTSKLFATTNNRMITVFNRVKRALTYGIRVGDVHYEFLAWGNSQLREHGVYFVAPTASMSADSIRAQMGSFVNENVVAKKAARMGQCFSTTRAVHLPTLQRIQADKTIPDVVRNGHTFTDGVGKLSELAASLVSHELKIKGRVPSLFQFRLGGCKGVLATSKDVPGIGMQIRDSQFKFDSLSGELEIIRYSQFWQPFLNRQIILVLRHLGVPDRVFLDKQDETIQALKKAMHDDQAAVKALRSNVDPNLMTLNICELIEAGFRKSREPFVTAQLHLWRSWTLKYLKEKAKIPVTEGAFVLGTVDETATLKGHTRECPSGDRDEIIKDPDHLQKLPEIFIQITDPATNQLRIIEGLCIIARNPSLHQGDIRVVRAVDNPLLRDKCDVVVMPQTGDRDLPSMCSGGDLDGDDYIVIWDEKLIPQMWNAEPFHYEPEPPKKASGEITTKDLIDFYLDYLRFDMLGRIAFAHLAAADALDEGIESEICQELTRLHSNAVDYPKTGIPAKMERRLERDRWPHFMEKRGKNYHSCKVLGKLYDSVEKVKFKPDYDLPFDERILNALTPTQEQVTLMEDLKHEYDDALRRILTQHSIKSEFELWSTFVLDHSKKSRDYKFHEEVGDLSRALKEQYHEAICDAAGGRDFDHLAPFAVAAYQITKSQVDAANAERKAAAPQESDGSDDGLVQSEDLSRMPFMSFPWLLQDTLKKIALHADDSAPRRTTVNTQTDQHVSHGSTVEAQKNSQPAAELPSFADLHIPKAGLSQYLPDPLRSGLTHEGHDTGVSSTAMLLPPPVTQAEVIVTPPPPSKNYEPVVETVATEYPEADTNPEQDPKSPSEQEGAGFFMLDDGDNGSNTDPGLSPVPVNTEPIESETATQPLFARRDRRKDTQPAMCPFWLNGNCQKSEEQCQFAHWNTGVHHRRKEHVTCWFWLLSGRCSKPDERCAMAHRDTGITMPPPSFASKFDSPYISTNRARQTMKRKGYVKSASPEKERNRRRAAVEESDEEGDRAGSLRYNSSQGKAFETQKAGTSTDKHASFEDLAEFDLLVDESEAVHVGVGEAASVGLTDVLPEQSPNTIYNAFKPLEATAAVSTQKPATSTSGSFSFSFSSINLQDISSNSQVDPNVPSKPEHAKRETESDSGMETAAGTNEVLEYGDPLHNTEFTIEELSD